VHSLRLAPDHQLREDDRHPTVVGGVADVVLAGGVIGSEDHELVGVRV